jgi:hypothetical protein
MVWCGLVTAGCQSLGAVAAPACGPASRPAAGEDETARRLRRRVAELVEGLRSPRLQQREAAEAELLALQWTLVQALAQYVDDPDPEVQARVMETLEESIALVRFERVLPKLPRPQREKLLGFRKAHPEIVADLFSLSWPNRLRAVRKIRDAGDPDALAEPVVALCIRHPWEPLSVAAIEVAGMNRYRGDDVADALIWAVMRRNVEEVPGSGEEGAWIQTDGWSRQQREALYALRQIATPRAAAGLVALLKLRARHMEDLWDETGPSGDLVEAIIAVGDRRAVPCLMEQLKVPGRSHEVRVGGKKVTGARTDMPLCAVIGLTGQSLVDYGVVAFNPADEPLEPGERPFLGFQDDKSRSKAIGQLQRWWKQHKHKPPYKDLKPLVLPELGTERGHTTFP